MPDPNVIIVNGKPVPYEQATVHLLTPAVKYGALAFEGVRAYWNADQNQLYIFRLAEHLARFRATLRVARFDYDRSDEEHAAMVMAALRDNDIRYDGYIRLAAYVEGRGRAYATGPVSVMCAGMARASGPLADKQVSAGVVSWRRIDDTSMPPRLKVAANYHNARLGFLEAHGNGYDEALFLTREGHVAEAGGACFMMVRDGRLVTPAVTDGILESVTRRTVLEIASGLGIETVERSIDRTELYFCDEAFLCGTGAEIKPVVSIDRHQVGDGAAGTVTTRLWDAYEAMVRGTTANGDAYRTPVYD